MTDEPKPLPIDEAIEVLCECTELVRRGADTNVRVSEVFSDKTEHNACIAELARIDAALAAFKDWDKVIDNKWLKDTGWYKTDGVYEHRHYPGTVTEDFIWFDHEEGCICKQLSTRGDLLGLLHFIGVKL